MEFVHQYFSELGAFLSVIIWLVRLESKVNTHEKSIDDLDTRLTDFDSKILNKLSEIAERLSFIEGSLRSERERD